MSSKGYHWYNNSIVEINILGDVPPEGFVKGRLPVSDESREKMRESNWVRKADKERLLERNEKISKTRNNWSDEEKKSYSNKMSECRKGKGVGIDPWNKGKTGLQVAWNKGLKMDKDFCQRIRDGIANMSDEKKRLKSQHIRESLNGRIPWNKDIQTGPMPQYIVDIAKQKEYETKMLNGTFNTSKPEDLLYDELIDVYDDVVRGYRSDKYPFTCDFYIEHLSAYIELNLSWTHYTKPFDENDEECLRVLNVWKKKSETSDYYKNAIYTWTNLDVRKRETAKLNDILYISIYKDFIYLNNDNVCTSDMLFELLEELDRQNEH